MSGSGVKISRALFFARKYVKICKKYAENMQSSAQSGEFLRERSEDSSSSAFKVNLTFETFKMFLS